MGKIYVGKPMKTKSRRELIASLKPYYLQFLRADNGDLPEDYAPPPRVLKASDAFRVLSLKSIVISHLVLSDTLLLMD